MQVAVPYSNALECNNTLLDLARFIVAEVEAHGGEPRTARSPFPTATVTPHSARSATFHTATVTPLVLHAVRSTLPR